MNLLDNTLNQPPKFMIGLKQIINHITRIIPIVKSNINKT